MTPAQPISEYHFFGLKLRSQLPLTSLPVYSGPETSGPITLTLGHAPLALPDPIFSNPFLQISAEKTALIRIAAIGAFHLPNENEIIFEPATAAQPREQPAPSAQPQEIESILLSTVAGILLHSRAVLPLHASCVLLDGRAIAFSGSAGSGKSTLAAAFLQRHPTAKFLADNLCALDLTTGKPAVHLAVQHARLWPDVMDHLNIPPEARIPIRPGHPPCGIAQPVAAPGAYPLTHLFRLGHRLNHGSIQLTRVTGPQAIFNDHKSLLYQQRIGRLFGNNALEFRCLNNLARHTAISTLRCTRELADLDLCLDLIDAAIKEQA